MYVSVIIPAYNAEKWLEKTLRSVLRQKYLKEIVIVDDHSTDRTPQIAQDFAQKYPSVVKYYVNPGEGANTARNFGFLQSSGDFIQWLDADDLLLDGKFEAQVVFMLENPAVDIVYSDWYMDFYDENLNLIERKNVHEGQCEDMLYVLLQDKWKPNNSYLLRRRIAEKLHRTRAWNPSTPVAQDREYFTLAALEGARFAYVPGFFSVYNRWSSGQVSAMDFKRRLEFQVHLEKRFRDIILQKPFPRRLKRKYLACLNAHVLNACYYHSRLTITYPFSLFNVNWRLIHWKKYPFMPVIYTWQILKYTLKNKINN